MAVFNNILAGSSGQAVGGGAYEIERSLRFNSDDSAYLSKDFASAGNRKTWTWAGWVKRSAFGQKVLFSAAPSAQTVFWFDSGTLEWTYYSGGYVARLTTNAVYRDTSAWMHILLALDTTQVTADNRVRLYVNGTEVTSFLNRTNPLLNAEYDVNNSVTHYIGWNPLYSIAYFDGYLADVHFIDGQALDPTSFGEFDTNGVWQPIEYTGSYGTNGFHLPFSDNSTAAALGTDTSGNNNTWTVNNISVAAGSGNDSLVDVPTASGTDTGAGGEVRGNYATLNPLDVSSLTTSNGNLQLAASAAGFVRGTMNLAGKTYWEVTITTAGLGGIIGVMQPNGAFPYTNSNGYHSGGTQYVDGSSVGSWGASWTAGDLIGISVDADAGTVTAYKNGVSQGSKSISSTATWMPWLHSYNGTYNVNFGQRPFAYTAPSGFKALCTTNLPDPVVAKPSEVFDAVPYTGSSDSQSITTNFSPDLVWVKTRNAATEHELYDTVRGAGVRLSSNVTLAESNLGANGLTSFNSNGFTVPSTTNYGINGSGYTYAAWTWDAGSSTVTNNDGSIESQVRANPSAGFSIVTYSGVDTPSTNTVGHGLGVAPALWIIKNRTNTSPQGWVVNFTVLDGSVDYMYLNLTNAKADQGSPWNTLPTSTVFTLGANDGNTCDLDSDYVAYCFAPVAGYSSFGSYTGNGSADGPFVYTGFRPRWVMIKASSITGQNWYVLDSARDLYNLTANKLEPNTANQENASPNTATTNALDFLSNGFKLKTSNDGTNQSGATYVWAAFAEHPFQTARAR